MSLPAYLIAGNVVILAASVANLGAVGCPTAGELEAAVEELGRGSAIHKLAGGRPSARPHAAQLALTWQAAAGHVTHAARVDHLKTQHNKKIFRRLQDIDCNSLKSIHILSPSNNFD